MQCPQCGTENPIDAKYCRKCGRILDTPPASAIPIEPYMAPTPTKKRLVRCSNDKAIAGVCSGLAVYMGIDVLLVRILTLIGLFMSGGSVFIAYILVWLLVPEEPCPEI